MVYMALVKNPEGPPEPAALVDEQNGTARYLRSGGGVLFFLSSVQAAVWRAFATVLVLTRSPTFGMPQGYGEQDGL